jgi:predicted MFS family arabinose efflux permease
MLLLLNGANPPVLLYVGAFIAGMFLTVMSVTSPLMVHTVYGARDYTRIFVALSLAQNLLISMGASIIGFMFDFTGGYSLPFIVGAAITAATVCVTYFAFATAKKLTWS